MEGQFHVAAELSLAQVRLERIVQDGSGPFRRAHRLDQPSLVYLPSASDGTALGCFGEPASHRDFMPFGEAVVVPAHQTLHVRSPGFGRREMIVVRFDEARFAELTGIGADPSPAELTACVDVRAGGVIASMERLAIELARPALARETMVAGLGLVVLGELARHFQRQRESAATGRLADWQIHRIEARLERDNMPPPDIAELAGLCGIGRRHLMRGWKATTGTTVMERVERARFRRALRLLTEGDLPMKMVAARCGFGCPGSFATAFRRRFGETPTRWRARDRGAFASADILSGLSR